MFNAGNINLMLLGCLILLTVSCRKPAPEKEKPLPPPNVQATSPVIKPRDIPRDNIASWEFAIYLTNSPAGDPLTVVHETLSFAGIKHAVTEAEADGSASAYFAVLNTNIQQNYAPPTIESLKYSGVGLTEEDATALQQSTQAIVITFVAPQAEVMTAAKASCAALAQLTEKVGGFLWDEETRQVFSLQEWKTRRIDDWVEKTPDIRKHITIHSYREDDSYVRAVTLGMGKFGLPDVSIDKFASSHNNNVGTLINAFCQVWVEGEGPIKEGPFDFDSSKIFNKSLKEYVLDQSYSNATGIAKTDVRFNAVHEGDAPNRLVSLTTSRYEGPDDFAKFNSMIRDLIGNEDQVLMLKHNQAITDASLRAKQQIPLLRSVLEKGYEVNEKIHLKFPFPRDDERGSEYMWVEVTSWDSAGKIKGILLNEPHFIKSLKEGQEVSLNESDMFDFTHYKSDGSQTGDETSKLIQQSSE
ncbi:MAG: DUF2314 domain-containing protein [Verrucomicrobiota bacterium]|nr:DUF2314 domain-containing protein [Verrucomicrobiota bacterium]